MNPLQASTPPRLCHGSALLAHTPVTGGSLPDKCPRPIFRHFRIPEPSAIMLRCTPPNTHLLKARTPAPSAQDPPTHRDADLGRRQLHAGPGLGPETQRKGQSCRLQPPMPALCLWGFWPQPMPPPPPPAGPQVPRGLWGGLCLWKQQSAPTGAEAQPPPCLPRRGFPVAEG